MHLVGRLNRNIYKCIAEDIVTDEVVLTENQIQHINERHPETYEKVVDFLECAIEDPDYIIEDKHPKTGLIIKRIRISEEKYLQIVLRVCTSGDIPGYKNSIISCWEISESRLQNYLRNKTVLYKKE